MIQHSQIQKEQRATCFLTRHMSYGQILGVAQNCEAGSSIPLRDGGADDQMLVFSPLVSARCTSIECSHWLIGRPNLQLIEVRSSMVALGTSGGSGICVFPHFIASKNIVNLFPLEFCPRSHLLCNGELIRTCITCPFVKARLCRDDEHIRAVWAEEHAYDL